MVVQIVYVFWNLKSETIAENCIDILVEAPTFGIHS